MGCGTEKKRRYWPPAPIPALLQSGGAEFLAPREEKSMEQRWSGVQGWHRGLFQSIFLKAEFREAPGSSLPPFPRCSHPSLGAAPISALEALGCFSLHSNAPATVFQGGSCGFFCSRTDGTQGKHPQNILKTSLEHPLPLASTAAFDPKSTNTTQGPAAPYPTLLLPVWAVLSLPFPGIWVSPRGWECPMAHPVAPQGGDPGLPLSRNLGSPVPGAASLPNSRSARGEGIALFPSPACRAGRITTWPKGKLQLARWPRDSPWKIKPCPTSPVRIPRCKSRPEVPFPGCQGWSMAVAPGVPELGTGQGCPPGTQEVEEQQQQTQNRPNPGAHGSASGASLPRPCGSSTAFPARGHCSSRAMHWGLGRMALAVLPGAVVSSAPALAPRASPSSSLPAAQPGRAIPGCILSMVLKGLPGIEGSHGWWHCPPVLSIHCPFPAPSCPFGHQLPSTVPPLLPDLGTAEILTPGTGCGRGGKLLPASPEVGPEPPVSRNVACGKQLGTAGRAPRGGGTLPGASHQYLTSIPTSIPTSSTARGSLPHPTRGHHEVSPALGAPGVTPSTPQGAGDSRATGLCHPGLCHPPLPAARMPPRQGWQTPWGVCTRGEGLAGWQRPWVSQTCGTRGCHPRDASTGVRGACEAQGGAGMGRKFWFLGAELGGAAGTRFIPGKNPPHPTEQPGLTPPQTPPTQPGPEARMGKLRHGGGGDGKVQQHQSAGGKTGKKI